MMVLHSVVLPMPLRPIDRDRLRCHREAHSLERLSAAVEGVEPVDLERAGALTRGRPSSQSPPKPLPRYISCTSGWLESRRAYPRRSCGRRASSSRCSATESAMSMSCSIRISVISWSSPSSSSVSSDALAAGEAGCRLVEHASAARRRRHRRPRPACARRAKASRRMSRLAVDRDLPAARRARSRICRPAWAATDTEAALRPHPRLRGRCCPLRKPGEQPRLLVGAREAGVGPLPRRLPRHVAPEQRDGSRRGGKIPTRRD